VTESLGATVEWIQNEQKVIIKKGDIEIILQIDKSDITVNGKIKTMDTKAIIKDMRTFVPIRYVAEALGATVGWDAGTKTVIIKSTNNGSPNLDMNKDKQGEKGTKSDKPNDTDPNIVWSYVAEGSYVYYASPALSSDEETVYFGTSFAIKSPQSDKDRLIALNTADGALKWEYYTNKGEIRSNLKVYKDNIYFIADYGRDGETREKAELIAVSLNGDELWRKTIAGSNRMHAVGRSGVDIK
jgi:outer membrane protein assembly factor BamB